MMKMGKKLAAWFLAVICTISMFSFTGISASAANYTSNYSKYATPSASDYAYWNGKKVAKASGTTKSEIMWMQAALNYCIANKGLNAGKLNVDGSFGPASKKTATAFQKKYGLSADGSFGPKTISKMKDVLNSSSKASAPKKETQQETSGSEITTAQIQAVLKKYGYKTGKYWTYSKNGGSPKSGYKATNRKGRQYSYVYQGKECYGFANFVMHEVTGTTVNPNNGNKHGWKYIKAKNVTELKVGDIVRIGKNNSNGHSGVVLSVNSKGTCTFAECWGGVQNKINIGGKLSSSTYGSHSTLRSMKKKGVLLYVYRYVG